ncbi:MAG: hypothetical protein R6V04_01505, partial [bacterium]
VEFYQVVDNELQQIYSNKESEIDWASMSNIDGKIYFLLGRELYRYKDDRFIHVLSVDHEKYFAQVCGRHEKDLFIVRRDGIAHYNGTDIEYIYKFPSEGMGILGHPLILGKDIFFCMKSQRTQWYNMILHGKMVE